MKKIALLIFLAIISCKKKDFHFTEKHENEKANISFPKISNWEECYSNGKVKNRFDQMLVGQDAIVLGVYLENSMASIKESIDSLDLDDYSVFMDFEKYRPWKIENKDLQSIYETDKRRKKISSISTELALEKVLTDSTFIPAGTLIELEEYKSLDNVHTAVMLAKPYPDDHQYVMIAISNLINIQNHLIFGSYYLRLNGKESIELAKNNNKKIMTQFSKLNNQ